MPEPGFERPALGREAEPRRAAAAYILASRMAKSAHKVETSLRANTTPKKTLAALGVGQPFTAALERW